MAFNPDAYLAQKAQEQTPQPSGNSGGFNPDAYLASKTTQTTSPEEPGQLEALARSAGTGLTLGAEPAIAGAGAALGAGLAPGASWDDIVKAYKANRDSENAANAAAVKAHPVTSFVGNLAGSIPLALATAGLGEIAEAPAVLSKLPSGVLGLGKAVGTGAAYGAANAVGSGISAGKDAGQIGADAVNDSLAGGLTGGVLHGAFGVGKGVAGAIGDSDTYNNFVNAVKHTMDGVKITGRSAGEGVKNIVADAAENLGLGLRDTNKSTGATLGNVRRAMTDAGETRNTQPTLASIKTAIDSLNKSEDPEAAKDAAFLQNYYDNLSKGKEQDLTTNDIIPEKTIAGKASAQDKIDAATAAMEAKENALPKGVQTQVVPSTDDAGNPFLNILKSTPGEEEGYPNQTISKTLPNTPGVPDQVIPSRLGPDNTQQIRVPSFDPNETPFSKANDIKQTLTQYGGNTEVASPLKTQQAQNMMSGAGKGLNDDILQNPTSGEGPLTQIGQATKDTRLSYDALKTLGLDDTDFQRNPISGEMELTDSADRTLKNRVRQIGAGNDTSAGQNASDQLDKAMDILGQIDPQKAQALNAGVQRAAEINNLYRTGQGALFSKGSLLRTLPVQAGALVGTGLRESGLGTVGSYAGKVVSNVVKGVSNGAISAGAKALNATGNPTAMKLASELATTASKTGAAKNAALFSLMQQPGYRELLKKHVTGLVDDDQNSSTGDSQ